MYMDSNLPHEPPARGKRASSFEAPRTKPIRQSIGDGPATTKTPAATGVFSCFEDPCGLHIIWNDSKAEPATVNGKLLAFKTAKAAASFADVLNEVHRLQAMRRGGANVGARRLFTLPSIEGFERPTLV